MRVDNLGLLEKIFPRHAVTREMASFFKTLTAYQPVFTSWSGQIYESELVRGAINARATHISKLNITIQGAAKPKLQTALRQRPNDFMTWSQFFYRVSTILDVQNTAFLVPMLDEYGEPYGIYPVLPSRCTVVEYAGEPWLRYEFSNGQHAAEKLSACGILTKYQYRDDFFGSSNSALNPVMSVINVQNQGIEESVKNAASYRFYAQANNFTKPDDLKKERERFNRLNFEGEGGGMLLFPNTYTNIQQMKPQSFVVDSGQMEYIRTNVESYFGVNEKIMQNSATSEELDAFYNGAIEPFAIQLSEVLTDMLFTKTEQSYGAKIFVNSNRLQYMATRDKISLAQQLGDRGMILIDEIRELFNYPPLPDGAGQHAPIRGEYYFTDQPRNVPAEGDNNG